MTVNSLPFIGREKELKVVQNIINKFGTKKYIFVSGVGGIGKTRFLQEVERVNNQKNNLTFTSIIDFDDYDNHISQNIGKKIATQLSSELFAPYLIALIDYRKLEASGVSIERLSEEIKRDDEIFVRCFNEYSEKKRVVVRLDTIDSIDREENTLLIRLLDLGKNLDNVVFFIAGRKAGGIYNDFLERKLLDDEKSEHLVIPPLDATDSKSYLDATQKKKHITIGEDLKTRLVKIADGRPIFIDLAVEWVAHDDPLNWILETSVENLEHLSKHDTEQLEENFVRHIAQLRNNMDRLLLLLSIDYPSTPTIISKVLGVTDSEGLALYNKAIGYTFIKIVGTNDDSIILHDEMRRLILDYVWPLVQEKKIRMKVYRERVIQYLDEKIKENKNRIETENSDFFFLEELKHKLWKLQRRRLMHYLKLDPQKGVTEFSKLYDDVADDEKLSFREVLVSQLDQYLDEKHLTNDALYQISMRRARYYQDRREYKAAKEIVASLLRVPLLFEQEIQRNILLGNILIRLSRVDEAIELFHDVLNLAEAEKNKIEDSINWLIKINNVLGWAYRLKGYREIAYKYYSEAMRLCEENDILDDDYGLLLNNMTYILSFKNREAAIDYGKMAVKYWKQTDDLQKLGMAYQVLGAVFYQHGSYKSAKETLDKALHIFANKLELQEWEGRVLSWRGALHQSMDELDQAESDLLRALEIGSYDTKAMTLNRLGRVYMSSGKRDWEKAKDFTRKSYELAAEIPDYVYYVSSFARLLTIAAEQCEYDRFEKLQQELERKVLTRVDPREIDKNALGVAYFALGRLALGAGQVENAKNYLTLGIENIVEFGVYARKGVRERLAYVENNFPDVKPNVLEEVAESLIQIFNKKANEPGQELYRVVVTELRRWKRWKGK